MKPDGEVCAVDQELDPDPLQRSHLPDPNNKDELSLGVKLFSNKETEKKTISNQTNV